jgi:hypothetical protein
MYSSAHAAAGAAIYLMAPSPALGMAGAFLSHFLLDYLGESAQGDTKQSAALELSLLALYMVSALHADRALELGAVWVLSNLPDLIDKPLRWFFKRPEWFSCHNGKGLFQYKGYKLGYPVRVRLTRDQTLSVNVGATLALSIYLILAR